MNESNISYEVTARKKADSTLDESAVKLYLTEVNGDSEEEVLLDNYSNLTQTTKVSTDKYTEKTIYTGKVYAGTTNYEQAFRLRMWIDDSINFSPVKDENGNDTYPYNGKTFTVTVNVYANAKVVTDEDIADASKAEISSLSIDGIELTAVEGQDYDYETSLPEGTTSTTINVETISEYATVTVEKIDSLAIDTSNVKRLSTKKTLELTPGDNYFKVTVTSENKKAENEFILKISVGNQVEKIVIFNKEFEVINAQPILTDSSNNTTDVSGLYKSTATNSGDPTYYFRGNVENNYVDFAGFTWRVVRVNEDGTIRLILVDGIDNNTKYKFNTNVTNKLNMYYSESDTAKPTLETWYKTNIVDKGFSDKVATGNYFCEQAKVISNSNNSIDDNGTVMNLYNDGYISDFTCVFDGNNKGLVNASVGLINYDEVLYAGGYYGKSNDNYYLYNNNIDFWTMSPNGFRKVNLSAYVWRINAAGSINALSITSNLHLRPVINLKADVTVTGNGTSDDHWVVQ